MYQSKSKKHHLWKSISYNNWTNWQWQLRNRVTDAKALQKILNLSDNQARIIQKSLKTLRMAITPYYLSQIDQNNPLDPIRLQSIPQIDETLIKDSDFSDPLHEEEDCPVHGLEGVLTHRYPDRLIIYVTYQCAMYCRHCTRRRHAGETDIPTPWMKIVKAVEYIRKTKKIRDVLISGGDPFTLSTVHLERIITLIRSVKHVEVIRFGTRTPVTLPMRITDDLVTMLSKYHPIWVNTHFNHPAEMTNDASIACNRLADAGIPVGNQTVLLRRVNNHPLIMKRLMKLLVANRVRPYYIYQCDLSQGIEHFRTRICEGVEIMEHLRGHISGFAVPTFVVDGIGGGGKIPIMPNYVLSQGHSRWVLRNYEGVLCNYSEPGEYTYEGPSKIDSYIDPQDKTGIGAVADLLIEKNMTSITPRSLHRHKRRKK